MSFVITVTISLFIGAIGAIAASCYQDYLINKVNIKELDLKILQEQNKSKGIK
jgi:hypothetical protein